MDSEILYDIEVFIRLTPTERGGRKKPIYNGYKPSFTFDSQKHFSGEIHLLDKRELMPGESAHALVKLLPALNIKPDLRIGDNFSIFEGSKLVGLGDVENIVKKELIPENIIYSRIESIKNAKEKQHIEGGQHLTEAHVPYSNILHIDEKNEEVKLDYMAVKSAAMTLRAINHKLRQQIVKLLEENKRMNVTDIYVKLRLEQSVASQHLAILRRANIVITERDGKFIHYVLNHARIAEIAKFVNKLVNADEAQSLIAH